MRDFIDPFSEFGTTGGGKAKGRTRPGKATGKRGKAGGKRGGKRRRK